MPKTYALRKGYFWSPHSRQGTTDLLFYELPTMAMTYSCYKFTSSNSRSWDSGESLDFNTGDC